jgi:hypothetical protein
MVAWGGELRFLLTGEATPLIRKGGMVERLHSTPPTRETLPSDKEAFMAPSLLRCHLMAAPRGTLLGATAQSEETQVNPSWIQGIRPWISYALMALMADPQPIPIPPIRGMRRLELQVSREATAHMAA